MAKYVLIIEYGRPEDSEDIGVMFFPDKRALNKYVNKIVSEASHYNQYTCYICKVIGMVDYTKRVNNV